MIVSWANVFTWDWMNWTSLAKIIPEGISDYIGR